MINLLIKLLKESVEKCYVNDKSLIERSMEQACVARIYYYMQFLVETKDEYARFREYNLDCEYNKNGEHIKETQRCINGTKPDLIIHKRGNNQSNLLVVEFKPRKGHYKKYAKTDKYLDIIKLEDFTIDYIYNYKLGAFVQLYKQKPKYTFFSNGQEVSESELSNE